MKVARRTHTSHAPLPVRKEEGKSYLIRGIFSEPDEAQQAANALCTEEIAPEDIYLDPRTLSGRKGGAVHALETKRRFAGLENGLLMGVTTGFLVALGIVLLGNAVAAMIRSTDAQVTPPPLLTRPILSCIGGALIGLLTGGLAGGIMDYALGRLRAETLPPQETPIAVRCDADHWSLVYSFLSRAGARQLSMSRTAAP
jgi:hypothetical protein